MFACRFNPSTLPSRRCGVKRKRTSAENFREPATCFEACPASTQRDSLVRCLVLVALPPRLTMQPGEISLVFW